MKYIIYMTSYLEKYLKYKNKYQELKKNRNQKGGAMTIESTTNDEKVISEFMSPLVIPYETTKTTYNINGNIIHLIKIILNSDVKPVLFTFAGMSHKSFLGTSSVVVSKLDLLKDKFKEIYLVEYASFSPNQINACGKRDTVKKTSKDMAIIYKPELDMNEEIASNVNDIVNDLHLSNVHLLGKCNGGWIVTLLLLKNDIYKGLYLAVPGIPFNVDVLNRLSQNRLEEINFVFGWVKQDGYPFDWGNKSFQEKDVYDGMMKSIKDNKGIAMKYKSLMYDNGGDVDEKKYHEIYPQMINDIVSSL